LAWHHAPGTFWKDIPVAITIPGGDCAAGSGPYGIAFDGANIWVANYGSNNVTKL